MIDFVIDSLSQDLYISGIFDQRDVRHLHIFFDDFMGNQLLHPQAMRPIPFGRRLVAF